MLHTHEVTGSSPVVSTKKDTTQSGGVFFGIGIQITGLEQIQSQYASGILLPPVQKLVATLIKSSPVVSKLKLEKDRLLYCCMDVDFEEQV